jgi:hypothetical protein
MKTMQARFDEHSAEFTMTRAAAERVFQLLARWAVRRAKDERKKVQGRSDNRVTTNDSKG